MQFSCFALQSKRQQAPPCGVYLECVVAREVRRAPGSTLTISQIASNVVTPELGRSTQLYGKRSHRSFPSKFGNCGVAGDCCRTCQNAFAKSAATSLTQGIHVDRRSGHDRSRWPFIDRTASRRAKPQSHDSQLDRRSSILAEAS